MTQAKIEWPPKNIPPKFPLTAYRDGWCKTVNGQWRHICGKLPFAKAKARFQERMERGDFGGRRIVVNSEVALTCKQLCNLYIAWLQKRLDPKHRRRMSPRTLQDYMASLQLFIDTCPDKEGVRLADVRVAELRPRDFTAFTDRIPGSSPYTRSRYVATIRAMFKWAGPETEGIIDRLPTYGADFSKATRDELREARANLTKAYNTEDMRRILQAAMHTKVWWPMILMALNGAFSNIELARLRVDQVDLESGLVQSVRGKKGRAYRKTLLWPVTIEALRQYQRPSPARPEFESIFFLTRNGLPYVRHTLTRGAENVVMKVSRQDTLTTDFGKLIYDAGLQREGRSFSGLRTTFRNEAEAMENPDNDAIDLIVGHPRRHISSEYVEKFPFHRLQRVTDFVFNALFGGWAIKAETRQQTRSPSPAPVADPTVIETGSHASDDADASD